MPFNDAHIHVGYYPRVGYAEPFYYSPQRIVGILNRAGVDEFIFSSTNAVWDFEGDATWDEAREVVRLAGASRAHPFFWVTDEYLKRDRGLSKVPDFYEGIKLHGGETPWLKHPHLLRHVLSIAKERMWLVQIHTGESDNGVPNPISAYLPYCREFAGIRFDLAHGSPPGDVPHAVNDFDNVYVDCAYRDSNTVQGWIESGARESRIMFGSDIPVQQRLSNVSLTAYLRKTVAGFKSRAILSENFKKFTGRNGD